jgi:hypothetical protein
VLLEERVAGRQRGVVKDHDGICRRVTGASWLAQRSAQVGHALDHVGRDRWRLGLCTVHRRIRVLVYILVLVLVRLVTRKRAVSRTLDDSI